MPRWRRAFAEREVDKTYIALIQRPPIEWPKAMSIDSPIAILKNGTARVDSSGLPALTQVRVLSGGPRPVRGRGEAGERQETPDPGSPRIGRCTHHRRHSVRLRLGERSEADAPRRADLRTRSSNHGKTAGDSSSPRPAAFTVSLISASILSTRPRRHGADPRPGRATHRRPRPGDGRRLRDAPPHRNEAAKA